MQKICRQQGPHRPLLLPGQLFQRLPALPGRTDGTPAAAGIQRRALGDQPAQHRLAVRCRGPTLCHTAAAAAVSYTNGDGSILNASFSVYTMWCRGPMCAMGGNILHFLPKSVTLIWLRNLPTTLLV